MDAKIKVLRGERVAMMFNCRETNLFGFRFQTLTQSHTHPVCMSGGQHSTLLEALFFFFPLFLSPCQGFMANFLITARTAAITTQVAGKGRMKCRWLTQVADRGGSGQGRLFLKGGILVVETNLFQPLILNNHAELL